MELQDLLVQRDLLEHQDYQVSQEYLENQEHQLPDGVGEGQLKDQWFRRVI